MSKKQITFKIIENKPIIPNNNNYIYEIHSYDTQFKDHIYFNQNNQITDTTNFKKSIKYIIKLLKKGKIFGVGNFIISQELFTKKIKQKRYNNINLFITENNYKKIFPNVNSTNSNKIRPGIVISLEINIKYNITEKEFNKGVKKDKIQNYKKMKLMKRNLSYQDKAKIKNEYSVKSSNNYLTTSTSNINTYNNINNCYDSDNNINESNANYLSSEKYSVTSPSHPISSNDVNCPFSEPNVRSKKKKMLTKNLISSISFQNNNKNKHFKIYSNKIKDNILYLRNRLKQTSSRNKKIFFNKKKLKVMVTQETSSSNKSNSITQSSLINSVLIEKDNKTGENNLEFDYKKNMNIIIDVNNINNNNDEYINININTNENKYNDDNEDIDYYILEIDNKKNRILKEHEKTNRKLFIQDQKFKRVVRSINNYENKIKDCKFIINRIKDKTDILKFKDDFIYNKNKEIIPIISKVKESKEIENDIFHLILKNREKNDSVLKKNNFIEKAIEKYNKNLMIKMIKNVIQNNQNVDVFLNKEQKSKLKNICDKYYIFSPIIEESD